MDTETIRAALRTDFNATLRALADHIAQTYTGPEDTRIEIAHAIARHLGLEGWPSAWDGQRSSEYRPRGHERLWLWFGLSRASWLTMPRVMMHAMPEDWQDRMAALCEEWDEAWDTGHMPYPQVRAVNERGQFAKWPSWVLNYRHPQRDEIVRVRRMPLPEPPKGGDQ